MINLKNIKRTKCGKCKKRAYAGIPLERCRECKNKFCPDHFWRCLYRKDVKKQLDELQRVVCDECKEKFGYIDISEYSKGKNQPSNYYLFKSNMHNDGKEFSANWYKYMLYGRNSLKVCTVKGTK